VTTKRAVRVARRTRKRDEGSTAIAAAMRRGSRRRALQGGDGAATARR
jgi:hypothetical protein